MIAKWFARRGRFLLALGALLLLSVTSAHAQADGQRIDVHILDASSAPVAGLEVRFVAEDGLEYGTCITSTQGRCRIEVDPAVPTVGVTLRGMLDIDGRGRVPVIWLVRDGGAQVDVRLDATGAPEVDRDVLATRAPQTGFPDRPFTPAELAATATALATTQVTVTPPPGIEATASTAMAWQTATAVARGGGEATGTTGDGRLGTPTRAPANTTDPLPTATTSADTTDMRNSAASASGPDWLLVGGLLLVFILVGIVVLSLRRSGGAS